MNNSAGRGALARSVSLSIQARPTRPFAAAVSRNASSDAPSARVFADTANAARSESIPCAARTIFRQAAPQSLRCGCSTTPSSPTYSAPANRARSDLMSLRCMASRGASEGSARTQSTAADNAANASDARRARDRSVAMGLDLGMRELLELLMCRADGVSADEAVADDSMFVDEQHRTWNRPRRP